VRATTISTTLPVASAMVRTEPSSPLPELTGSFSLQIFGDGAQSLPPIRCQRASADVLRSAVKFRVVQSAGCGFAPGRLSCLASAVPIRSIRSHCNTPFNCVPRPLA